MLRNPSSKDKNIRPLERVSSLSSSKQGDRFDSSMGLKITVKRSPNVDMSVKPIRLSDEDSVTSRSTFQSKKSLAPPSLCESSLDDSIVFEKFIVDEQQQRSKGWTSKIGKLNCLNRGKSDSRVTKMKHYSSLISTEGSNRMLTLSEEQQRNWKSCSALPLKHSYLHSNTNDEVELITNNYSMDESSQVSMSEPLMLSNAITNPTPAPKWQRQQQQQHRRHSSNISGRNNNNSIFVRSRSTNSSKQRWESVMADF